MVLCSRRAESFDRAQSELGAEDEGDARRLQPAEGVLFRAVEVEAAAGVTQHHSLEPQAPRVFRRPQDAEVEGQAREEDTLQAALAQIAGEPGRRLSVVLEEIE